MHRQKLHAKIFILIIITNNYAVKYISFIGQTEIKLCIRLLRPV